MSASKREFESLEQQFLKVIGEFRSITISESRLRETLRSESTRAEAAEVARATAERATDEARSGAAAATAAVTRATAALEQAQEQLTGLKIQLDLSERQRAILEERIGEMVKETNSLAREVQQLRPLQVAHTALHRQYTELQDRVIKASEEARRESSRLESELRRVEKSAAAGAEIRERARLAAAAHARERRLTAAELQHTEQQLLAANGEITKLKATVAELELLLSASTRHKSLGTVDPDVETLSELKATLEAERAGNAKLEKALAAALADMATLTAHINAANNNEKKENTSLDIATTATTNIFPIDSFLAE